MRSAGYDVLAAGSGDEGLEQVRERPAALILLDDDLPGMTGLEVCRRIGPRSDLRDSFVVRLSGKRASSSDRTLGLQAGVDAYIAWPIANQEFLAHVEAMVRLQAVQAALRARTAELEAVRAGTADLLQERDPVTLLQLLVRRAAMLIGVESGTVLLWSEAEGRLIPHASIGRGAWANTIQLRLGEGIIGTVAQTRRGMVVNEYQTSPYANPCVLAHAAITAVIAEPLMCRDTLLGVITLSNERTEGRTFCDEDGRLLALFAAQAAIAIENANLYAAIRGHAAALEQGVAARTADLERALRIREELLARVSHEFRTPLNFILGFSDLLQRETAGPLTPTQRRYLDRIRLGGQHLLDLVNDLLEITASEASRERFRVEEVSLPDLVREVLDFLNPQIVAKHIRVTLGIPAPCCIVADRAKLARIMRQLVANAVKFTPSGGQVALAARDLPSETATEAEGTASKRGGSPERPEGRVVEFSVADTGIGIAPDHLARIFGAFEQADGSAGRAFGGAGLGLALVRTLVELHGGTVWAESQGIGTGARFVIRFPQGRLPDARRILAVDDDPNVLRLLSLILGGEGYQVAAVGSVREALAALRADPVDLVVLDLGLPDGSGLEVLREVRVTLQTAALPVLMLTGRGEADGTEAIRQGANEYLSTPMSATVLLRVVSALLREAGAGTARRILAGRIRRFRKESVKSDRDAAMDRSAGDGNDDDRRVLIAEDDPSSRDLLTHAVEVLGYHVHAVADGEAAWEAVQVGLPDLILSDVTMPGLDGFGLCRRLKADPRTRLIPVILITGIGDEHKLEGIEAGADDFLGKPVSLNDLRVRMRSLIRMKAFTDELDSAESVLMTLAASIEAKDPYTEGHCERLAALGRSLGLAMGADQELLTALQRGGYLHDLGKIGVPEHILVKPGALTAEEWEIIQQHPVTGERICRPLRSFRAVLPIIRHHHEKVGRIRVPRRVGGGGDPSRRAHPASGGRVRCTHHGSSLPPGAPVAGGSGGIGR